MKTIKAFTSQEQSEKLAKILPLESADMVLPFMHTKDNEYIPGYVISRNYIEAYNEMIVKLPGMEKKDVCKLIQPVWSLAALLEFLRNRHDCDYVTLTSNKASLWCLRTSYYNHVLEDAKEVSENAVDACYEMILKLHELKML